MKESAAEKGGGYLLRGDVDILNVCILTHHRHVRDDINGRDVSGKDADATHTE